MSETEKTPENAEFARRLVAGLTLVVPLLVVVASWLLLRDQLPAELASHWPGLGQADDAMPVAGSLTISLVMSGLAAFAGVAIALWPSLSAATRRGGFFFVGLFAGLGAVTWLLSAGLTLQAGDPYEAVLGGWVVLLVASAGYGIIAFLIAPKPVRASVDQAERLHLEPSEAGAWSRTMTGTIFVWLPLVLIIVGGVICAVSIMKGRSGGDSWFAIIMMAVAVVLVAAFIRVRVTADWRGLRVGSSLLHIPLKRIRLDQIAAVEALDVLQPREWGGWGFRVMPGRSALILKKGPGVVVTTTQGKQFAITVPDPQTPAALLTTLRDGSP